MKLKILVILIIISSIFSGFIGTFIMLKYFPNIINLKVTNIETLEIQKENKEIKIKNIENNITNIIKNVSKGVVSIVAEKDLIIYKNDPWGFFNKQIGTIKKEVGGGTGFFITKEGIIITNEHVVSDKESRYKIITNNGKEYESIIIASNKSLDLALLKIKNISNEKFYTIDIIKQSEDIKIGQFSIAIGNALNEFKNSVSLGVISGKNREIVISDYYGSENKLKGLLQTDAAINNGNSGGPLINLNGQIIGINTAIAGNSQGIGFSRELNQALIRKLLKNIK